MSRPDELVTLAEVTSDFRALMEAALVRRLVEMHAARGGAAGTERGTLA